MRLWTHKRHPISCSHRPGMGCLLWGFQRSQFKLHGQYSLIHQIHKSHYAPVPNPSMHHSEQKCALWDMGQMHSGICETGLFKSAIMCLPIQKVLPNSISPFWPKGMSSVYLPNVIDIESNNSLCHIMFESACNCSGEFSVELQLPVADCMSRFQLLWCRIKSWCDLDLISSVHSILVDSVARRSIRVVGYDVFFFRVTQIHLW